MGMGNWNELRQWATRKCDRCATIRPHSGCRMEEPSIGLGHKGDHAMDGMSLDTYQRVIGLMKQTGRVREAGHVLYVVEG